MGPITPISDLIGSKFRSEERRVGKEIIPSCKVHMMEEETLSRGLKGGRKEELGEEE